MFSFELVYFASFPAARLRLKIFGRPQVCRRGSAFMAV
jgi:hypothetical protein